MIERFGDLNFLVHDNELANLDLSDELHKAIHDWQDGANKPKSINRLLNDIAFTASCLLSKEERGLKCMIRRLAICNDDDIIFRLPNNEYWKAGTAGRLYLPPNNKVKRWDSILEF